MSMRDSLTEAAKTLVQVLSPAYVREQYVEKRTGPSPLVEQLEIYFAHPRVARINVAEVSIIGMMLRQSVYDRQEHMLLVAAFVRFIQNQNKIVGAALVKNSTKKRKTDAIEAACRMEEAMSLLRNTALEPVKLSLR